MSTSKVLDYDVSSTSALPEYPQYETEYIDSPCNQYLAEVDNNETRENQKLKSRNLNFKKSRIFFKPKKAGDLVLDRTFKISKSKRESRIVKSLLKSNPKSRNPKNLETIEGLKFSYENFNKSGGNL